MTTSTKAKKNAPEEREKDNIDEGDDASKEKHLKDKADKQGENATETETQH